MLTKEQKANIEFYRTRKQSTKRIAALVKASESEVAIYIESLPRKVSDGGRQSNSLTDPTPEEIEAACALLREQQRRYPRYDGARESDTKRMPRHFAAVPRELLK